MALSGNIWWTRKARIQAEKRLLSHATHSQVLLLWYSFSGVASAIYYLEFDSGTTDVSGIVWVVFSVLVLCISGFINGLSFKERASLIKESYETLNDILRRSKLESADSGELGIEYDQVLSVCENHLDRDFYAALCLEYVTNSGDVDSGTGLKPRMDRSPTWYHWCSIIRWHVLNFLLLSFLYTLPVLLFYVTRV